MAELEPPVRAGYRRQREQQIEPGPGRARTAGADDLSLSDRRIISLEGEHVVGNGHSVVLEEREEGRPDAGALQSTKIPTVLIDTGGKVEDEEVLEVTTSPSIP